MFRQLSTAVATFRRIASESFEKACGETFVLVQYGHSGNSGYYAQ